jgi:outer membrane biosynthesis protein TonB
MSIFDNLKKVPTAAWWWLTRSPKLLRRGVQGAALYAASLLAEKLLDAAHEELPDNKFLAKADSIAHAAVTAENFLIGGAAAIAKSAYDAIPARAAPLPQPEPKPEPKSEPVPPKVEAEAPKLAPPPPPIAAEAPRQAAFMPVEPAERNRANLNAKLAPDGLPEAGGYEPSTGITWGGYMKPVAAPPIGNRNLAATVHLNNRNGFDL